MSYLFQNATAFDPYTGEGVPNASGQVFAMSDTAFATPLTVILLSSGLQTTELVSDQYSQLPGFDAGDNVQVRFRSGEFVKILNTSTPLVGPQGGAGKSAFEVAVEGGYAGTEAEYNASLTDAPSLVARAEAAETGAVNAANLVGAPADEVVATLLQGDTLTQTAGDNRWVTNEGADTTVSALLASDGSETQAAGDSRYLREVTANSLYTSQLDPRLIGKAVSIQYKTYGSIKYSCTTIHMGGTPDARALKTYWDEVQRTPSFQAREHDIELVRDAAGATVIGNGAGLVHSVDAHGEGAVVTTRGAVIIDGVPVQDFPTDGYWTGYEGFAMLRDGTLKGYSALRGQSVGDAVNDGAEWLVSFGPILVEEGMARDLSDPFWATATSITSSLNVYGQRANGDIVMIGGPGKSSVSGGTLADSAAIALAEGCDFAISMDRGGSAQTFVGGTPIVVSQDRDVAVLTDYNKRLVANYLYTNLPVVSPVKADKPDLFYTATLFKADPANAKYVPRVNVSSSGRASLTGRMILTPSGEGGTLTAWPTTTATGLVRLPPYARPAEDAIGVFYGNAKNSGRYQVSAADGVVRISNCDAGMTYALLDQIQWQIDRAF